MTAGPPAPQPPSWPRRLLAALLPRGPRGEQVLRDLEAEFRDQLHSEGPSTARRWYAWEALKLCVHFGLERIRSFPSGGIDPRPGGPGSLSGTGMMERAIRDLRLSVRSLSRQPGFSLLAILTMALGIGANTAIFSVVDTVLLESLPYRDGDRLVALFEWNQPRDRRTNVVNPGNFRDWRDRSSTLAAMSAVSMQMPGTVNAAGEPQEAMIQLAHPDFFHVLGMEPVLGRLFTADAQAPVEGEILLSHGYWTQRFGGDPGVLGNVLQVNGEVGEVVGVLPDDYVAYGKGTKLWYSYNLTRGSQESDGRWLWVVGRVGDETTFQQARAELDVIAEGLQEEYPDFNAGWWINAVALKEHIVGDVQGILWVLMGAVGLLLLIASANVANLLLIRGTERQKEMAILTSLGATGRSLASKLMTESLVIAAMGAGLGIGLAFLGVGLLSTRIPQAFAVPRLEAVQVDGTVLLIAVAVTGLTGVLFGMAPALQAAFTSPATTLGAESRGPSRRTGLLRNGLVVAEMALSLVLLGGAALMGRSLAVLLEVDPGFRPEQVLVGRVNLSADAYGEDERKVQFYQELLERLESRPGVRTVGGVTFLPMDGLGAGTSYYPMDRPAPEPEDRPGADIRNVAGDYFQAMGISLLEGRTFDSRDGPDGPRTAVVNRTLAEEYWAGESALGKPVFINWETEEPWEIVGVVEDVRMAGLAQEPREAIYLSYPRAPYFNFMHVVARGTGDPTQLATVVRNELHAMDPTLPLGRVRAMEELVADSAARPRMTAFLMALFAGIATLLAAVGLYGVLAYAVSRRVREIGIRMAVGAGSHEILRMVIRQGGILALLGLAIGLVLALAGGRVVTSLLYQVQPTDPLSLAGAGLLLLLVALAATAIPAWRASRVPPAEALRNE